MFRADNPAKKAYDIGQAYIFQQSYGKTPDDIKEKLKEEVRAELLAEAKLNKKKKPKVGAANNDEEDSLRDIEGKGTTPKGAESQLTELGDIFDR